MIVKLLTLAAALAVLTYAPPSEAYQSGGEMLLPFNRQYTAEILHPRAQIHPNTKLPLPSDCQAEEPKRGVLEPGDPMAAAVHQERHEQDEEIQTGQVNTLMEIVLSL